MRQAVLLLLLLLLLLLTHTFASCFSCLGMYFHLFFLLTRE